MMRVDAVASPARSISFMPKSGPCYDYCYDNHTMKKTVWLVPHVIKYKDDSEVITWRCNWGTSCESKCLYAMARERSLSAVQ